MNSMTVLADPIKRGDLMLESGDIQEALAWFRDKIGRKAQSIILHPENKDFANEVGEVKIAYLGDCFRGEVWLSAGDTFITSVKVPETRLEMPEWDKSIAHSMVVELCPL